MIVGSAEKCTRMSTGIILMVVVLVTLGLWIRLRHLSDLGLIADEGVQAQAVERILQHGLPMFDSGLFYSRGLPFLYAQAEAAKIFGLNEFSLRLPAALFGAAAIWAAFLLGNAVFSWRVGLLTAAVMTFSVWEIEMSRYARFYTVFQFMYLISLWCFYRGFIADERAYKLWFVVTACIAFVLHDLGVMLATSFLALLPSRTYSSRRKLYFGVAAGALVGLWCLYYIYLRRVVFPVADFDSPADETLVTSAIFTRLRELLDTVYLPLPDVSLLMYLSQKHFPLFLTLALVALSATGYLIYSSMRKNEGWRACFALVVVWSAFMHQLGLVLVVLTAYLYFFLPTRRALFEPPLTVAYGAAACCALVWGFLAAIDPTVSGMRLLWAMFSYPNFYDHFLQWYVWGWPVLTAVFAIGIVQLVVSSFVDRAATVPLFILGSIFIPAVAASFFQPHDDAVRYTFHLYPLMIIVFAFVSAEAISRCVTRLPPQRKLARGLTATAVASMILLITEDANPVHAWSVGDWTYRNPRHPIRTIRVGSNTENHPDYKSPSLYVRERLGPHDKVIVAGGPVIVAIYHFYVRRVDYALSNRPSIETLYWRGGELADIYVDSEIITVKFKITDESLQVLKERGVPTEVLRKLDAIKNQEFSGEPIFLNTLKTTLGVEEAFRYKRIILKAGVLRGPDTRDRIKQIIENNSGGHIWFVGNWDNLMTDERDYSDPSKEYLRLLIRSRDYVGLDGQTFAVRLNPGEVVAQ
jgi:Dolichyl-phosphate-mannose-protein mannosyltransferase